MDKKLLSFVFILVILSAGCIDLGGEDTEDKTPDEGETPDTKPKTSESQVSVDVQAPSEIKDEEVFTVNIETEETLDDASLIVSNLGPYLSSRCRGENPLSTIYDSMAVECDLRAGETDEEREQEIIWELHYFVDKKVEIDDIEIYSEELFEREEPSQNKKEMLSGGPLEITLSFEDIPGKEGEEIKGIIELEAKNSEESGVLIQEKLGNKFEIEKLELSFPRSFTIRGLSSYSLSSSCETERVCYQKSRIKLENNKYSDEFYVEIEGMPSSTTKETFKVDAGAEGVKYYEAGSFEVELKKS